jgi:hypothetical protein
MSCCAGELYVRGPLKARNEAFKELLRREKQYVANLQLIVKEYMKPLKENTKGYRALCTDKEVMTIFGNVEALTPAIYLFFDRKSHTHWLTVDWLIDCLIG